MANAGSCKSPLRKTNEIRTAASRCRSVSSGERAVRLGCLSGVALGPVLRGCRSVFGVLCPSGATRRPRDSYSCRRSPGNRGRRFRVQRQSSSSVARRGFRGAVGKDADTMVDQSSSSAARPLGSPAVVSCHPEHRRTDRTPKKADDGQHSRPCIDKRRDRKNTGRNVSIATPTRIPAAAPIKAIRTGPGTRFDQLFLTTSRPYLKPNSGGKAPTTKAAHAA